MTYLIGGIGAWGGQVTAEGDVIYVAEFVSGFITQVSITLALRLAKTTPSRFLVSGGLGSA
ncbi:MAG: hypothetical protein ACK42I_03170 [Thermomicrobium sp.]